MAAADVITVGSVAVGVIVVGVVALSEEVPPPPQLTSSSKDAAVTATLSCLCIFIVKPSELANTLGQSIKSLHQDCFVTVDSVHGENLTG